MGYALPIEEPRVRSLRNRRGSRDGRRRDARADSARNGARRARRRLPAEAALRRHGAHGFPAGRRGVGHVRAGARRSRRRGGARASRQDGAARARALGGERKDKFVSRTISTESTIRRSAAAAASGLRGGADRGASRRRAESRARRDATASSPSALRGSTSAAPGVCA